MSSEAWNNGAEGGSYEEDVLSQHQQQHENYESEYSINDSVESSVQAFCNKYVTTAGDYKQEPQPKILAAVRSGKLAKTRELYLDGKEDDVSIRMTDEAVFPLFEALGHSYADSPISSIDLSFNRIQNYGAKAISVYLMQTTTLTSLNLNGNYIQHMGAERLADALVNQSTLRSLKLHGNPIGDAGAYVIGQSLEQNNCLTELDLGNTETGQRALVRIATALRSNCTLKVLNLDSPIVSSIQEETTTHLAKMLQVNSTLQELSLVKHGMRDFGASWVAFYLGKNHTLTHLDLSGNKLSTTGVAELATSLHQRSAPCYIKLTGCPLRGQHTGEVQQACASEQDAGSSSSSGQQPSSILKGGSSSGVRNEVVYASKLNEHALRSVRVNAH